jgi:beta-lactamase regulating signal transducer with metallopeptidase domain
MELLIPFALKSLLIAGVTLGLLHLLRSRSAAERGMVAHFGLLALLIMPLGSMFLPQLVVEVPAMSAASVEAAPAGGPAPIAPVAPTLVTGAGTDDGFRLLDLWPLAYGLPALLLLGVTLLAVMRLLALRTKASILVEPSWLSALAQAQRRMNFKHGTALLTSSDLQSPISWGVLRPVILLNDEALEARHEAEAIIAHELAHVRGLDWAKLLLARIVTAIFWFNPLIWLLAREAHQLREETADDAVLEANVASADYAQLLVGVARHDCNGLLLGAHGVAPGKGSLSRRVRRVLDASLPRAPVARGFAAGIALGVIGTAAPLAAVTFSPTAQSGAERTVVSAPEPQRSLPLVVAQSVAGATALTSEALTARVTAAFAGERVDDRALDRRLEQEIEARVAYAHRRFAPVPSADPRLEREQRADSAIDRAIAAKAVGVTPDYAAQIRAAAPGMRIDADELVGLKAVGVTPQWLGDMARAGYRARDIGDVTGAKAVGVSPAYVAELSAAGYRNLPLGDLTAMRALGVTGKYIRELRAAGITGLSTDRLLELRAQGISASALRMVPRPWPPGPVGHVGPRIRIHADVPDPPDPPEVEDPDADADPDE